MRLLLSHRARLVLIVAAFPALCAVGFSHFWWTAIRMPGDSYAGALPSLTDEERALAINLERHVRHLASDIGERHLQKPAQLQAAADWIENEVTAMGQQIQRQTFLVDGSPVHNLELVIPGLSSASDMVVVGAHYDSAHETPAANDNGSGVAALLELARLLSTQEFDQELRLVWFCNEEPPHFQTENMGSLRYARGLKASGRAVRSMLSLETLGYYSDEEGSQHYPGVLRGFYPTRGNFVAFVANTESRDLLHQALARFRKHAQFPSEGAALPAGISATGWSDHWSFWQIGVPALMVTDTAPFRYPHYHRPTDTADQLDYLHLARVVVGLHRVIEDLAGWVPIHEQSPAAR